jgi:glycosyltransferase involved in cell wall biosynthesis
MTETEKSPLVIGVWLEYSPVQSLTGEGISRLTSWILQSLSTRNDVRIVIAMAKWSEADFRAFFEDHQVTMDRVEILPSRRRTPLMIRLMLWIQTRKQRYRPRKKTLWYRAARALWLNPVSGGILRAILTTDSYLLAAAMTILSLVLFPLILAASLIAGLSWKMVSNRATHKVRNRWHGALARAQQKWRVIKSDRRYPSLINLWKAVESHEFQRLARKASRRKDVHVWYTPNPSATAVANLTKPLVVAVPDLVYIDFVNAFRDDWVQRIDARIRRLALRADAAVSYSEDVKSRHLIRHLGVPAGRAHVIRHGAVDAGEGLRRQMARRGGRGKAAATSIIQGYINTRFQPRPWMTRMPPNYLRDFPFDETEFLFVSSQIRPNKNYLNLFIAFERLLRWRYRNLKLIVTGDLQYDPALLEFVDARGLDLDILSLPNIPRDVHAAFYHLAALTVVPTLFEGGFPFQFSESMSVGTPVVMSDIAATREVLPERLVDRMLFDPTDPMSIAARIEWALDNRDTLRDIQTPFYEEMKMRTWDKVADEYLDVFREVAAGSGNR